MTSLMPILNKIESLEYPIGMEKMDSRITGAGFFPGASGASDNFEKVQKSIMILGQDQDNEIGFKKSLIKKDETYTPTWRHLKSLFEKSGISMEDCFFTNCIPAVRISKTNTGKSPAFQDPGFVEQCAMLLAEQIQIIEPKLIICLGLIPFKFFGLLSREILLRGVCTDGYTVLDEWKFNVVENVGLNDLSNYTVTMAVICHPSYRALNVKYRIYQDKKGEDAEVQMLKDLSDQIK